MKICKIWIKDYDQFQNLELDFTDPATGETVDKVCFIGSNGTGKTKILNFINGFLKSMFSDSIIQQKIPFWIVKIKNNSTDFYILKNTYLGNHLKFLLKKPDELSEVSFLSKIYMIENIENYLNLLSSFNYFDENSDKKFIREHIPITEKNGLLYIENISRLSEKNSFGKNDLVIFSPAESVKNDLINLNDIPETSLDIALKLFNQTIVFHSVSPSTTSEFWTQLIFLMKKRESDFQDFLNKEENKRKVYGELEAEFDKDHPKIENALSRVWNQILGKANLELAIDSLKKPVQLTENLQAYIQVKKSKQWIPYNELSTGIRNFIFRLGHIYSLYFNQEIKNGFLLVDEPENSLYPDFLFDLIEIYQKVVLDKNNQNNTQMFFATHNPIVAAQFKPHERILLDWNEDGSVSARKGRAPEGDDPNDILRQDFELTDLMGKQGKAMWVKYVELKSQLSHAKTFDEKEKLISEINGIGSLYNF